MFHEDDPSKEATAFTDAFRASLPLSSPPSVDCRGFVFPKGFDWHLLGGEGRTLPMLELGRAQFPGDVSFAGLTFNGPTDFGRAVFKGLARFDACEFGGKVGFTLAVFESAADFRGARFRGPATFNRTHFGGEATFVEARFDIGAPLSMRACLFEGNATFSRAQIDGPADFTLLRPVVLSSGAAPPPVSPPTRLVFRGRVSLVDARFGSPVHFRGVDFSEVTQLQRTSFADTVDFEDVVFSGPLDMSGAKLNGGGRFTDVEFLTSAALDGLNIGGPLLLEASVADPAEVPDVRSGSARRPTWRGVSLGRVAVSGEGSLCFRGVDLGATTFMGTDLRAASFEAVRWPRLGAMAGARCFIADEKALQLASLTGPDRRDLAARLRVLFSAVRQTYESKRIFDLAGDFHAGEMRMRARQLSWWSPDRWALAAYRVFAHYGESWLAPLFWLVVLVFGLAALELVGGLWINTSMANAGSGWDWLRLDWSTATLGDYWGTAVPYTLRVLSLQRPVEAYAQAAWLGALAPLIGAVLVALLILGLRRRFRR